MVVEREAGGGTGSARRRRERRLRSMLRHERMSVAMALAESTHHSAPRGQKTARAGGEARDALHGHVPEAPLPQGRIVRHVVGHLPAPSLDVPVPQMVDQLPDIEHFFAALSPDLEQVIEVPKILPLDVPMRAACALRSWWNSWWKCRRPCLSLRYSGLWNSSPTFQFLVVEDQVLVFMVFSQDSVQQRRLPENAFLSGLWSRSLTLFLVEVFLVHLLLTLQLVMKNAQMSLVKGFFALFPNLKKCEGHFAPGVGTASAPQLMDGSGSAGGLRRVGAAQEEARCKTYFWNRRTNSTVWRAPAGVEVVWYGEKDEVGGVWYWHRDTRVSTFELPPLPPG